MNSNCPIDLIYGIVIPDTPLKSVANDQMHSFQTCCFLYFASNFYMKNIYILAPWFSRLDLKKIQMNII